MSDSLSLEDAIEGLASDKIKTRTLALTELRRHFSSNKTVQEQAPKSWNNVFVALFDMCKTERNTTVKKSKDVPAAALRRLNDATAAIRWLIERTAPVLQRKTVKVLLSNIFKEVLFNKKVHEATALDYIKSLRLLLAHAPHLNHLEEVAWLDSVELCYGAAMSTKISFFGDDWTGEAGLQLEDEDLDDVAEELSGSKDSKTVKAPAAARLDTKRSGQELTEIFTVLAYLFQSHNASAIILPNSRQLLQRAIILFRLLSPSDQSPETTAHFPLLQALNALLVQVDLNTVHYMAEVGPLLWRLLMRLWAVTRSLPIKEQIIIALTRLVPPVFKEQESAKIGPESCARECWERILNEPEARSRIEPLIFEHLRLRRLSVNDSQKSIFSEQTFQGTSTGFSASDALSWTTMKLAADCLQLLHQGSDKFVGNLDGPGPSKRRKVVDPVEEFLNSLENGTNLSSNSNAEAHFVYRLQILLFFISRHWDALHTGLQSRIFQTLLSLLNNSEPTVQCWVLLCIAVLIPHTASESLSTAANSKQWQTQISPIKMSKSKADVPSDWEHIWLTSLRKLNGPQLARPAAYCLDLLMATSLSSTSRINRSRLVADLDPILRDLTIQGPQYPCDTVCWFFVSCLELARDDVVMSRLDLPEKVFGWLCSGIWRPASRKESTIKGQAVDTCAMLALLLQLTVGQHTPFGLTNLNPLVWPTCESTRAAISLQETEPIRKFIYAAELPQPRMTADEPKRHTTFPTLLEGTTSASIANRLSSFLAKSVEEQDTNLQNLAEQKSGFQLPLERIRRLLQLCAIVILFEGALSCTRAKFGRLLFLSAANLLRLSVPLAAASKWKPFEKAELLSDLQPIFAPFLASRNVEEIYPGLIAPGYASMIPQAVIHQFKPSVQDRKTVSPQLQEVLRKAWSSSDLAELLDNGILSAFLLSALSGQENTGDDPVMMASQAGPAFKATQMDVDESDSDDSFGGKVREGGVVSTAGRSGGASILGGNVTSSKDAILRPKSGESTVCTRVAFCGLLTLSWLRNGLPMSHQASQMTQVAISDLSYVFSECKEENFFSIARGFLDATAAGAPPVTLDEAESIMARCATDFLPLYKYAREDEPVECIIKLLGQTQHLWIEQHPEATDYRDKARTMCTWLTDMQIKKKVFSWRMRLQLVALLDSVLRKDSIQSAWGDEEHPLDAFGQPVSPRRLISGMVDDIDIRIRFKIACLSAMALDFIYQISHNEEVDSFFNALVTQFRTDLEHHEHILTRLLCLSNTMISCSRVRFQSYNHMVIVCQQSIAYEKYSVALLKGVAARLGLSGVEVLFSLYAPQFTYTHSSVKPLALPESICGFPSTRARAEAVFLSIGGFLASEDDQHDFTRLSDAIGLDVRSALSQCFPYYLANVLVDAAEISRCDSASVDAAYLKAQKKYRQCDLHGKVSFEEMFARTIDLVAVRLLSMLYEVDCSANGPIKHSLLKWDTGRDPEGNAAKIFGAMFRNANATRVEAHGSVLYSSTVIYALHWLSFKVPTIQSPVVLQSVFSQMLVQIDESSFVDDQLRLLASLVVMIALARSELSHPVLYKRLLQGFAALYNKPDLAHAVWACINYMFMLYEHYDMQDSGTVQSFPSIVVSIIKAARDHSGSSNHILATAAQEHLQLLRSVVDKLVQNKVSGSAARQHGMEIACQTPELNDLASDCTFSSLTAIAHKASAERDSCFDLVNFLASPYNNALTGSGKPLGNLLWNLLTSLPERLDISEQSAQAFLNLLCANRGSIALPTLDSTEPAPVHISVQGEDGIQADLIRTVAALLSRKDITVVGLALNCLRNIFAATESTSFEAVLSTSGDDISETSLVASKSLRRPYAIDRPPAGQLSSLHDLHKLPATTDQADFSAWLTAFTQLLLAARVGKAGGFYLHLQPLCQKSPGFARAVLPMVVHSLLLASIAETKSPAPSQILTDYFTGILRSKNASDQSLAAVVDTIMYLRKFPRPSSATQTNTAPLSGDLWLSVPWSLVAQAAIKVKMPSTAILCLELTREHGLDPERVTLKSAPAEIATSIRDTQSAIYAAIDEPDGFYGIQFDDAKEGLAQKYRHERNVTAAFELVGSRHEASFVANQSASGSKSALIEALSSFGFSHLALATLQNPSTKVEDFSRDAFLDLAWRTEAWDLPSTLFANSSSPAQAVYSSLRDIHRSKDRQLVQHRLAECILQQTTRLGSIGPERPQPDSKAIQALLALNEVQLWLQNDPARLGIVSEDLSERLISLTPDFRYADAEMVMNVRITLLRGLRRAEERLQYSDQQSDLHRQASLLESACHLRLSERARQMGSLQMSLNSISAAENLIKEVDDIPDAALQVQLEQELAQVLWKKEEHVLAIQTLIQQADSLPVGDLRKARMLAQLGTWSAEARLLDPAQIRERYFEPATTVMSAVKAIDSQEGLQGEVSYQYAMFADRQYLALEEQRSDFVRLEARFARRQSDLSELSRRLRNSQDPAHQQLKNSEYESERVLEQERVKLEEYRSRKDTFLRLAIRQLSYVLTSCDHHDDTVHRLCALWFAHSADDQLNKAVAEDLQRIPSSKFTFLSHQLAARLSRQSTSAAAFQTNLKAIVHRLCLDHPFHILYQLFPLRQGAAALVTTAKSRRTSQEPSAQLTRGLAAEDMYNQLRKSPKMQPILQDLDLACEAYVEWASCDIKSHDAYKKWAKNKKLPTPTLPEGLKLRALRNMRLPVSTIHLHLDPTCQYNQPSIPMIQKYAKEFRTAGGVNLPKISDCLGSDGVRYKQLFKGGDDTRQDAVMEQVFSLVNDLLSSDERTSKRSLRIRTYKVLPLTGSAGLMEHAGAVQLSDLTTDLLKSVQPSGWSYQKCRGAMQAAEDKDVEARVEVLRTILQNNRPVLRHMFYQKQHQAYKWFQMRLNYTRSVATNSIVGFILGIGDRHTSNLLFDPVQGEIVPIDFGVAFDSGTRLPIPELVPFRLTQNFVDAFGMSGVEGVYRRCCEETLRVLREKSSVIMTILEVFKYDPLQKWTVSADKVKRVQNSQMGTPVASSTRQSASRVASQVDLSAEEDDVPTDAAQALAVVAEKLSSNLSVEYKVNELIQQAMDIRRLAVIFRGWQPYI